MFLYMLRNTVRNVKRLYDVKLFLKENYSKGRKEAEHDDAAVFNSLYNSSHSDLFFNDVNICVERKSVEEKNTLLFNKVRNDKRHRKRAFQKRGYWKKMHYFMRKSNMMSFAFKMQNIDYEKMKKLKRGEVYST
ncbi:hypothetical protein, conserved [Plasmodium gonderi]|uniref:Uncharacterized protein n=1 Tax=Plasmodium gonderi TaxID=77519 RepID=A0A1Y1JFZ7_PLAGO|nr:hypothetical protein, conserved [Plasmodium gonderi]GAW81436.1 hypothetical protein, conserved [Plasmodium gonderi]